MSNFKPMDPDVFAAIHEKWIKRSAKPRATGFGRRDANMTKSQFSAWVARVQREEADRRASNAEHLPPRKEAP